MDFKVHYYCWPSLPKVSKQTLNIMKLIALILFAAGLQVSARGYSQITLSETNTPLEKVFQKIKQQSGYDFVSTYETLKDAGNVTVNVQNVSLQKALNECLQGKSLTYVIIGKTVVVKPNEKKSYNSSALLLPEKLLPPPVEIHGTVLNEQGQPLQNVSVLVAGTKIGTTTNKEGNFTLTVPDNKNVTLEISSVSYITKKVSLGKQSEVSVVLQTDVAGMSDVVVVGYGTQKRSSVTAAISTLNGKDVASTPIADLSNSLGGRVPGVIVRQNNGEPGNDGSDIYIRGISSTGGNQPLLIVDGIPRNFKQLDPNSIKSYSVLKDAAAVAPYGVAGANGVILVTTKTGKNGDPSVTYDGYVGFQNPTIFPNYVSGYQFGVLQNAAAKAAGVSLPYSDIALQKLKDHSDPDAYPDPNVYRDLVRKNTVLTNHHIEVSGGTEKVKYYGSFGYQQQNGMWPTTSDKKYNLDFNLSVQATQSTKITFGINGRLQNSNYPSVPSGFVDNSLFELIGYTHTQSGPLYFSNGMPGTYITSTLLKSGYNKVNTTSLYSQISIDQDLSFIPGLKAKVTVAYDPNFLSNKIWHIPVHLATINTSVQPYVITDGIFGQTQSSLNESFTQSYQLTTQASLNYARSFGKSNISALALFETKDNGSNNLSASRMNYNLDIDEISLGSSSNADMTTAGTSSRAKQIGLVYRTTYAYENKYLFEASGRYDGSYYFAPNVRFGFFPAFSVGWRLSEENFMKNIHWINNLKIRGSYGEVGALAGAPFQYLSTFSAFGPAYVLGGQAVQGVAERNESNPNITWERAKKSDVGFETTLWNGLLNLEVDYFYEKRSNMLVKPDVLIPAEYGIGLSQVNAGIMQNQGIDLSIGSNYRISKDLQVSLSGNITYAKNTLVKVFETSTTFNNPNRRLTGKSLGTQFGFHALGFFQVGDFNGGVLKAGIASQPWGSVQPGDIRYEDVNKDGKINEDDFTKIGDPNVPQLIYGISPSVHYKGFALDILLQGAAKANIYLDRQNAWAFYNGMSALVENMNYWTPENPNASNPRITSSPTTNNTQTSSFWMKSGSYLRLKSATVSYTIPISVLKKIGSQNARVFVSGQNIITLTNLKNFDPESTGPYSNLYPQQKVISVGLNVTF